MELSRGAAAVKSSEKALANKALNLQYNSARKWYPKVIIGYPFLKWKSGNRARPITETGTYKLSSMVAVRLSYLTSKLSHCVKSTHGGPGKTRAQGPILLPPAHHSIVSANNLIEIAIPVLTCVPMTLGRWQHRPLWPLSHRVNVPREDTALGSIPFPDYYVRLY